MPIETAQILSWMQNDRLERAQALESLFAGDGSCYAQAGSIWIADILHGLAKES